MFRLRAFIVLACLTVVAGFGSAEAAAPFDLTLAGPAQFVPGGSLAPFSGTLSVAGVGVPNQTIEVRVDGTLVSTAATTVQGGYAFSLAPFGGIADRLVTATAFGGTPLATTASHVVQVVRYPLTVTVDGSGPGAVTSNGAINCPGTCDEAVPATTEVELTAEPGPDSVFAGWYGDCVGRQPTCTVTMSAARTVGATFVIPAQLDVSPGSRNFGSVPVGQNSQFTFTVTNVGGAPSGGVNAFVSGPDVTHYSISGNTCMGSLAPAATCAVTVRFSPTSGGMKNVTLNVAASPGGTVTASLTGTGVANAQLQISPPFWYPSTGYNTFVYQNFTVTNVGGSPSGVLSVSLAGDLGAFAKMADGCHGIALNAGQSCLIQMRYTQTNLFGGSHGASLMVNATPGGSIGASLNGN